MATYRLKKDHYLQVKRAGAKPDDKNPWEKEPQLHEQGSVVEWDGKPSLQMEPVDKEAKERVAERQAEWADRKAAARAGKSAVGWSQSYERNMERIITRSTEPTAEPMPRTGQRRAGKKAA